jgi:hypothetical protein
MQIHKQACKEVVFSYIFGFSFTPIFISRGFFMLKNKMLNFNFTIVELKYRCIFEP